MTRGGSGRWVAVAVVVLAGLAGCSSGTAGTPTPAAYQPLSAASVTAIPMTMPEGSLAVSPDGTTALVRGGDDWCLEPVTGATSGPVTPTDSAGASPSAATPTADRTGSPDISPGDCLALPEDARVATAAFSPDGAQVVLAEDFAVTLKGRMWLVGTADRSVREVSPTATAGSGSATGTASTTQATASSTRRLGNGSTYYLPSWDRETGGLFALEFGMGTGANDAVVEVDRQAATAAVVATLPERASGQLVAGGGTVVAGTMKGGSGLGDLVVIAESDRTTRQVDPSAAMSDRATTILLAAVSPDGKRVVALGNDQRRFEALPPVVVDLDGGTPTTLSGFDGMASWAAAYSPDGALLAVLTTSTSPRQSTVQLVEGSNVRPLTDVDDTLAANVTLEWSRSDILAPRSSRGPLRGTAAAWQLSD